jgi:hypothetical protein
VSVPRSRSPCHPAGAHSRVLHRVDACLVSALAESVRLLATEPGLEQELKDSHRSLGMDCRSSADRAAVSCAETHGVSGHADLVQPCGCLRRMRRQTRCWCGLGVVSKEPKLDKLGGSLFEPSTASMSRHADLACNRVSGVPRMPCPHLACYIGATSGPPNFGAPDVRRLERVAVRHLRPHSR